MHVTTAVPTTIPTTVPATITITPITTTEERVWGIDPHERVDPAIVLHEIVVQNWALSGYRLHGCSRVYDQDGISYGYNSGVIGVTAESETTTSSSSVALP